MDFEKWRRTLQFLWYFQFFPKQVHNPDPTIRVMKQASVDKTLARYAYEFLWEGRKEEEYQKKYAREGYRHRGADPINPENDESDYKFIKWNVQRLKRRFKRARRLAQWVGFKVRPKVADYLTPELLYSIERRRARGY